MKLTEKEEKIARLALDKAAQPGERQAAAAKLIESLYVRGVSVEDIEKESVPIEYRDRVQTQTVYGDRPVPRRSRPQFSVVPRVLPFKTPEARENARRRCLSMLEESIQIERERIALSDQGLFRSTASIEIHWRAIKLNERLIVTAMRAGREKLADLTRVELKRTQNELLRATGWPVEKPQPTPEPARAPQPTTPTKWHDEQPVKVEPERSHVWTWILGVAAAFAILLILLTSAHSNSAPSPAAQPMPAPTPTPTPMTAEERKQQEAGWEQFKEADRKERELLQKQEAERKARYEAEPEQDSIIGATPAPQ